MNCEAKVIEANTTWIGNVLDNYSGDVPDRGHCGLPAWKIWIAISDKKLGAAVNVALVYIDHTNCAEVVSACNVEDKLRDWSWKIYN
ncbi:MAG: hypothetical protein ACXWIF_00750 [Pyrinomonadaceae bacterium]